MNDAIQDTSDEIRATTLLEIGVEELPPSAVQEALTQLKEKGKELLTSAYLDYEKITSLGSSQRLIFLVEGLASKQRGRIEKEMGPPKRIVLDEAGKLTPKGKAYLKAKRIKKRDLGVENLEKGSYVYIKRKVAGKRTKDILPSLFLELISSLRFSKSMRWDEGNFSFARPIRSLLALFGEEVVKFEVAGVSSDRKTRGHRYLSPSPVSVENPQEYRPLLKKKWVVVDPEERKKIILKQIEKIASVLNKKGGRAQILEDNQLLEEIIYSIEYPTLFMGEFDSQFLSLPSPVLRACLRDYQKHFSVVEGGKPRPYFVGVREGNKKHLEEVVKGNQRVLNARLSDAKFFLEEDKKTLSILVHEDVKVQDISSEKIISPLKEIVVQEKLGSYYDKTLRLVKLADKIAAFLGENEKVRQRVKEAARLCKADLTTQIVKEFPSLQGIMGREYALYSGRDARIAQAILEHRMPRSGEDRLPQTLEGAILALADKLDTLVGSFWAGFIPSGSEDPWGLRREAQGIVEIILDRKWEITLDYLIEESLKLYKKEKKEIGPKIKEFLRTRIVNILKDRKVKTDQIKAVLGIGYNKVIETVKRGEVLYKASLGEKFKEEIIAIVRLINILKQAERWNLKIPQKVKEELLVEAEEKELYHHYKKIEKKVEKLLNKQRYLEAYRSLCSLRKLIHDFFEEVLVMDEDKNLRANRLSLLNKIGRKFTWIADFTKLQVK